MHAVRFPLARSQAAASQIFLCTGLARWTEKLAGRWRLSRLRPPPRSCRDVQQRTAAAFPGRAVGRWIASSAGEDAMTNSAPNQTASLAERIAIALGGVERQDR